MSKKPKVKEPKTTLGAIVSPEFDEMVDTMAKAMDSRAKGWLGARFMARGYLAVLEGERLLSDEEIKGIIADRLEFERVLIKAKQLLTSGVPSARPKLAQTLEAPATQTSEHQRHLAEIATKARSLLAQSEGSEISMEQAAEAIIQSLQLAGDKLFSKPSGLRVMTADEWADEDPGREIIDRSIESYSPEGG